MFMEFTERNTYFKVGTFSLQDPVHSWKAGPGEVMTVEKQTYYIWLLLKKFKGKFKVFFVFFYLFLKGKQPHNVLKKIVQFANVKK